MTRKQIVNILLVFLIAFLLSTCKSPVDPKNDKPPRVEGEWIYLGLKEETVLSILIHPDNPDVIFTGTGYDFSAQRDGKIFRSTDKGKTWEKVYEGGSFRGLLFHPDNSDTMFAWTHRPTGGLLRSTDGGDTWHLHSHGMWTNWERMTSVVLINPENPQIMYAGTGGFYGGSLYKSINGGNKWINITMNHWLLSNGATAMLIHPDQPDLLIHASNWNTDISRSKDGGETWEDVFYPGTLVKAFAINPENPDQIIAATPDNVDLLISEDRGKTWRIQEFIGSGARDLIFVKDYLYIAISGGVVRTKDFEDYEFLGRKILGYTDEGLPFYFPYVPRTVVTDPYEEDIFMGHTTFPWEDDDWIGGIYRYEAYNLESVN